MIRGIREVQRLTKMTSEVNSNELQVTVDIAAHKIKEVLLAKRSRGMWEQASLVSLLASDQTSMSAPLPDGALDL